MNVFQPPARVVMFLFALMFCHQVFGQETAAPASDEPTLQATQDWLKEKLEYKIEYTDAVASQTTYKAVGTLTYKEQRRYSLEFKKVKFDGCTMTWTTSLTERDVDEDGEATNKNNDYDHTVFLKDLDPANVRVIQHVASKPGGGMQIKGVTTPDIWNLVLEDKTPSEYEYIFDVFMFEDREMAKRSVRAFQNAIKQCGGKVQPF